MPSTGWCGAWYRVGTAGWVYGVGTGRGNTGYPARLLEEVPIPAKRAPEALQGLEWVGIGAGRARGRISPPCGPGRSLQALPGICSQKRLSGPIRRDLTSFTVKLVKTEECHQYLSIRPVIVPVSKTGSKSRLLKFSDFHILQPSLTRNY